MTAFDPSYWSLFALAFAVVVIAVVFAEARLSLRHVIDAATAEVVKAQLVAVAFAASVLLFVVSATAQTLFGFGQPVIAAHKQAHSRTRNALDESIASVMAGQVEQAAPAVAADLEPDLIQQIVATAPPSWFSGYMALPTRPIMAAAALAAVHWDGVEAAQHLMTQSPLKLLANLAAARGVGTDEPGAESLADAVLTGADKSDADQAGAGGLLALGGQSGTGSQTNGGTQPVVTVPSSGSSTQDPIGSTPLPIPTTPVVVPPPPVVIPVPPPPVTTPPPVQNAVPEPATWMAMITGLMLTGGAVRRRRAEQRAA